jgi:hypothetical protein
LGCNDIYTSWLSSPFKLYTNPLSSSTSYSRSNFAQACQDGCNYQHELCVSDYAGSFNGVGQSNGNVGGESGEQSYDKAVRECMQQFEDCVGLNDGINGGTHCESFGI